MTLLHPFTDQRQRSITVRELDRHGFDRLDGAVLVTLPGRVHCCAVCIVLDDYRAALLAGRPDSERADISYSDDLALAAQCCTGHRGRHQAP